MAGSTRNCAAMVEHVLHGDGQGVGVAKNYHTQGITDQNSVDAGTVHRQGGGIVIGCKHSYRLTVLFLLAEIPNGKFGAFGFAYFRLEFWSFGGHGSLLCG